MENAIGSCLVGNHHDKYKIKIIPCKKCPKIQVFLVWFSIIKGPKFSQYSGPIIAVVIRGKLSRENAEEGLTLQDKNSNTTFVMCVMNSCRNWIIDHMWPPAKLIFG